MKTFLASLAGFAVLLAIVGVLAWSVVAPATAAPNHDCQRFGANVHEIADSGWCTTNPMWAS
jgi:hypothetical protein